VDFDLIPSAMYLHRPTYRNVKDLAKSFWEKFIVSE
jgi:hypothetical protein